MNLPPCLVIESIEVDRDGEQASAELCIGPRRERMIIDYSYPEIWHPKQRPHMMDRAYRSGRLVLEVMARAYRGEEVSLPLDLSDAVRGIDEPWPFLMEEEHRTSAPAAIQVTQIDHDTPKPKMATLHMQVVGVPTVVIVDNRWIPQEWTRFRFVSGAHPWQLSDAEAWAMFMAIADAIPDGVSA